MMTTRIRLVHFHVSFLYPSNFAGEMIINAQFGSKNTTNHTGENEIVLCNQLGNKNRFSSRNSAPQSVKTMICNQLGVDCKIAITLENQMNSNYDINIEGKGKIFLVRHTHLIISFLLLSKLLNMFSIYRREANFAQF